MIGKILYIAYWEEFEQSKVLANKCDLSQKTAGGFQMMAAAQPLNTVI